MANAGAATAEWLTSLLTMHDARAARRRKLLTA